MAGQHCTEHIAGIGDLSPLGINSVHFQESKIWEISLFYTEVWYFFLTGFRRGTCKWFNVAKGWGFITPEDGSQDVFVHQSVIQMSGFRSLGDNEVVDFRSTETDKGLEALEVCSPDGGDCKGSHRRPGAKLKQKKVRLVFISIFQLATFNFLKMIFSGD